MRGWRRCICRDDVVDNDRDYGDDEDGDGDDDGFYVVDQAVLFVVAVVIMMDLVAQALSNWNRRTRHSQRLLLLLLFPSNQSHIHPMTELLTLTQTLSLALSFYFAWPALTVVILTFSFRLHLCVKTT